MKKETKEVIKKYFLNIKPIIYNLLLILTIYLALKEDKLFFATAILILIGIIYIISFISELITITSIYDYKNKKKSFNYKPYTISKTEFLEEIKEYGLPLTYIEINNIIYAIEVGKNKDKYLCYIDNTELKSLEELIDYKLGNTSINKQKSIKILSYNNQDPSILKER